MTSLNQRFTDALLAAMSPEERERLQKMAFEKLVASTPIEDLLNMTSPPEDEDILERTTREANERLAPKGLEATECRCCGDYVEKVLGSDDDVCGDCEEKGEEWEDVYNRPCPFKEFIHPDNKELAPYATGTFYQTYGGGPEGGYVKMPDGTLLGVERTWGQPFKVKSSHAPGTYGWLSRPADEGRFYRQIRITLKDA